MSMNLVTLVLLLCTIVVDSHTNTATENFVRHCVKLYSDAIQMDLRSKLQCAAECNAIKCTAFTFDKTSRKCRMAKKGGFTYCEAEQNGYVTELPGMSIFVIFQVNICILPAVYAVIIITIRIFKNLKKSQIINK